MSTTATLGELTGSYVIDAASSRIGFVVRQAMVAKVRGQFATFFGTAELDGNDPARSSARLVIHVASIRTGDERRDEHLRQAFFDSALHPTMTFASTRVELVDGTSATMAGNLTIRGVTRPVTVAFALTGVEADGTAGLRMRLHGTAVVNRKDWGVRWNAAIEAGGAMVGERVLLDLDVVAIRAG